jgi:hypothetical protein
MHSDIDFRKIRTLGGSQQFAFEEFCCHIARRVEGIPDGSIFRRYEGAGGDGGIECAWEHPTGDEWGWQAKYFFRLDKGQLDKSVETALQLHPNLKKYFICIPFDLTSKTARVGTSQAERLKEYEKEWRALAAARGTAVDFVLLTRSDLLEEMLRIDPSQGRLRFWFGEERIGNEWFRRHLEDAAKAAEPRYTPELNVSVPIADTFEAFGRTARWLERVREIRQEIKRASDTWSRVVAGPDTINHAGPFPPDAMEDGQALAAGLQEVLAELSPARIQAEAAPSAGVELNRVRELIASLIDIAVRCRTAAETAFIEKHGEDALDSVGWRQFMAEY